MIRASKQTGAGSPAPVFKEYWPFKESWLNYVKQEWHDTGRVQLVNDPTLERLEFHDTAWEAFNRRGIDFNYVKTYLSVQIPKTGEGYDDQFPHVHYPLYATTLIHYLQPGDKPAPLDILEGDEVLETIYPEPGLTVFVPNNVLHGVRINQGTIPRIQLIATALKIKRLETRKNPQRAV